MAVFHTPDGKELRVEVNQIVALRPVEEHLKHHVAPGTKTILYVPTQNFGVKESLDEAQDAIHNCIDGEGK